MRILFVGVLFFAVGVSGLCGAERPTTKPTTGRASIDGLPAIVQLMPKDYLPAKGLENWTDAQKEGFAKWAKENIVGRTFHGHLIYDDAVRHKTDWKVYFTFPKGKVGEFTLVGTGSGMFKEPALDGWGRVPRQTTVYITAVITDVHAEPGAETFWIGVDLGECRLIAAGR